MIPRMLLLGLALAAPVSFAQVPGANEVRSTTLANGMQIIVWPDRDIPNVDPAVNDARRALKAAIADAVRGSHVDQRKLADILQRAADDIRGLATPHDDTHGVDL